MKKLKRIVCLLTATVMIAACVAGCGQDNQNDGDVSVINIWSNDSHSKAELESMVEKFNKTIGKEQKIKIVYTVQEGNYTQIVDSAIVSNQAPEMFVSGNIDKYSENGDIIPLEEMPGGKELIAKYDSQMLAGREFTGSDGKVYRVPFSVTTFGLVYNKDMFKRYGIVDDKGEAKPPKTLDEVREYAKIMTDTKKFDYGIVLPMKWALWHAIDIENLAMPSFGRTGYDPVKGEYDFSVLKPVYEMYMGIKNDNTYFPGSEGLDNDPARAQFAERNIAMKFAGSYDVGVFNTQFPAKCDWGVAPMPVANENDRYKQYMSLSGYLVINKKCVDKIGADKLMTAFEWFHSDDVLRRLYEKGLTIPYDADIIDGANVSETPKGWKEFAELVTISTTGADTPPVDMQQNPSMSQIFTDKIWSGDYTIDEGISKGTKSTNDGMKRRFENAPNLKMDRYIRTDWNARLD